MAIKHERGDNAQWTFRRVSCPNERMILGVPLRLRLRVGLFAVPYGQCLRHPLRGGYHPSRNEASADAENIRRAVRV